VSQHIYDYNFSSSPEQKAFLIARGPSVRKHLYFQLLLKNNWANFNHTWHKASLGAGILNCSNEGPCPRGDNSKRVKIH
jgi:hypothetical protein